MYNTVKQESKVPKIESRRFLNAQRFKLKQQVAKIKGRGLK